VDHHDSGWTAIFPQAAGNMKINLRNQCRHEQFVSIPTRAAGAIREIEALSAGRAAQFAAGRKYIGFELAHLSCAVEAIPSLSTKTIED
jgi:hypothetical protein